MQRFSPLVRNLLLILVGVILAALILPLVFRNQSINFSLGSGNEMQVDCTSELSVTVQNQRAILRCAPPGSLTSQAPAALPTSAPATANNPQPTAPPSANNTQPAAPPSEPTASTAIYEDALTGSWQNWSWGSTIDLAGKPAHGGNSAISLTYTDGWSALYLHSDQAVNLSGFDTLRFWANGGSAGGQQIRVCGSSQCDKTSQTFTLVANTWNYYDVPLASLGLSSSASDLLWQNATPGAQSNLMLDDIALIAGGSATNAAPVASGPAQQGPALAIDAQANRHAISPLIYGMNFPDENLAKELSLPVQRFGGNATTRYNWKTDVSNRAKDWFFENIPNDNNNLAALPKGSSSDAFVERGHETGSESIITIPMIGWTPKSREVDCAFPTSVYPEQQEFDPNRPCGNGLTPDGKPITGNDPALTSEKIGPEFASEWIAHLNSQFGAADKGGVRFYNLDNEPFLWSSTHRDVHPNPVTYDEIRDLTYSYGAAVKKADPAAQTLGPAEWGWTGYFYSSADTDGPGGYRAAVDRNAHGGTPFVEWYLQQMREYEQKNGTRILDYFDLHFYPQGQNIALQQAGDANTQQLRLRSTRALWDPNYRDESWINEPVQLIPRMKDWVAKNYPSTKIALTEYNWGGLENINGALAQADILGIFGREGLDLATIWGPPSATDPGAYSFRMYRNYDGQGGQFGDTSVQATSSDPDKLAVFAAERSSDGATTVMVVNKTENPLDTALTLKNIGATSGKLFRYDASNLNKIMAGDDLTVANGTISTTFPAQSISLIVLPKA